VSVITPTCNQARYLDQTIQSVLGQDYPNQEYLVLDDGSADATPQVLRAYEGRLTCHRHKNIGEQATVNRGLTLARGKYVAVVNSDDPLKPGAISAAVELLEQRPELLGAYPDWEMIDEASRPLRTIRGRDYSLERMVAFHECLVGPGAVVQRRALEKVGGRNPAYRYVADFDLWLRLGLLGPMARIPRVLATWRAHEGGVSSSATGAVMAAEHIRVMNEFFARADLPPRLRRLHHRALSWAHYAAAYYAGDQPALRWKHIALFLLRCPANLGRWWQKKGQDMPGTNRLRLAVERMSGRFT
jgi:glycosyltransferase involved in cell wall biosynthesis